ncbi:AsmA-like C-terminal domain-containing protein [Roseospirillum parvum]|uniref:YhdP central domain-containing protein n=1 Tax=Roseospirillum parvum TaxID=83401 RepID=A0A1G7U2S5_9PROT|nr:AsmA-like C-terminal domain-containing protein [Roseospirillum parvum]SDG41737.1 Protein of unknown function [Roseospirillum parvum]
MVHGTVRLLLRALATVGLLLLLGLSVSAWRLAQGPVELDFLSPYLRQALDDAELPVDLAFETTVLTWAGPDRALDIRMRGVTVRDPEAGGDRAPLLRVPSLSVSLSARRLMEGRLALTSVEVVRPRLTVIHEADGGWALSTGDGDGFRWPGTKIDGSDADSAAPADIAPLLDQLAARLDLAPGGAPPPPLLADLALVRVVDAEITVDDRRRGIDWRVPAATLTLASIERGVALDGWLDLDLGEGPPSRLELFADLDPLGGALGVSARLANLRPADLAGFDPALAQLTGVRGGLDARLEADLMLRGAPLVRDLALTLESGPGRIDLPAPLAHTAHFSGLSLDLRGGAGLARVDLANLTVDLTLPDGSEGATVIASGRLERGDSGLDLSAEAAVSPLSFDQLAVLWPPSLAPGGHDWVSTHLFGGRIDDATFSVRLSGPDWDLLTLDTLEGQATAQGVTVDYLPPMPAVRQAATKATFHPSGIDLEITDGRLYGLKVSDGEIRLGGFDAADQDIDIRLGITGPLGDALRVVDHPPLGYVSKLGLDPAAASGNAKVRLALAFPLLSDLKLAEMDVRATATTQAAALKGVVMGQDLSQGALKLNVNPSQMIVTGRGAIGGIDSQFTWQEMFAEGADFVSRFHVKGRLDDHQRGVLGLDLAPFMPPFVSGPAGAEVVLTRLTPDLASLRAEVDLTETTMRLPGLDWEKPAGEPANASATLRLEDNRLAEVSDFWLGAGDELDLQGRVSLTKGGAIEYISVDQLRFGSTVASGGFAPTDQGGFDIQLSGPSFDATRFLDRARAATTPDTAEPLPGEVNDLPPITLKGAFDVVWVSPEGTLEKVAFTLRRDRERWQSARIEAMLEGRTPLTATLAPAETGAGRVFSVTTADAGALLRVFGLSEQVEGGELTIDGEMGVSGAVAGEVRMGAFRLHDAPLMARVLSIAALTGILDTLGGEGLYMSHLRAPFTYTDGVLFLNEARAAGPSLGITASGSIDTHPDSEQPETLDLAGTIVPAYAVNSVLGNIPLIGDIFTGGEKGGGVFAANYRLSGPIEAPETSVNALSALAPGFLRRLFDIFDEAPPASQPE